MRKYFHIFLLILFLTGVPSVSGQSWRLHTPINTVTGMAETRARVYFLSEGSLFAYDKDTGETLMFADLNILNDVDVTGVYAPLNSSRVAVTYNTGNIDIITDNGKVTNLPDIRDAQVATHKINSIAFSHDGNEMLVATDFGVVRYNLAKMEVRDSGIFNRDVQHVGYSGSSPVMYSDGELFFLSSGASIRDIKNWNHIGNMDVDFLVSINNSVYGLINRDDLKYPVLFVDFSENAPQPYVMLTGSPAVRMVAGNTAYPLTVASTETLWLIDSDNSVADRYAIPSSYASRPYTALGGVEDMWFGRNGNITNVDLTSSNPVIMTVSPGNLTVKDANFLRVGPSGNIYVGNIGNSNIYHNDVDWVTAHIANISPDGSISDITPYNLSDQADPDGVYSSIKDLLFIRECETNPSAFYVGDLHQGFYLIDKDGLKELVHYGENNSPMTDFYGVRAMDAIYDANGYLWLLSENAAGIPSLMALSPEGQRKGNDVQRSDWFVDKKSDAFRSGRDGRLAASLNKQVIYALGTTDMYVYDTKGTPDTADDESWHVTNFLMSDGSGYATFRRFNDLMVDPRNGSLWVTTTDGVFYIPKPQSVTNGSVEIVKPKVPRNDGTNLADYLLSSQCVYGIAADHDGTKWFPTRDSGIFHTNADGTEILANYTTSNSPIPSNSVYTVACDPSNSGKVWFGTGYGLVEYLAPSISGNRDYNEVKIYPNPVKPDYYGGVTIEGLVPGSRVLIVSTGGALVASLDSENGTAHWGATSASGRRVAAGVYHVLASSADEAGRPVGKIVVVR